MIRIHKAIFVISLVFLFQCKKEEKTVNHWKKILFDSSALDRKDFKVLEKYIHDSSYILIPISKTIDKLNIESYAIEKPDLIFSFINFQDNNYYFSNSDAIRLFRYNASNIYKGKFGDIFLVEVTDSSNEVKTINAILNENSYFEMPFSSEKCDKYCIANEFTSKIALIELILLNSLETRTCRYYEIPDQHSITSDSIWNYNYNILYNKSDIYKNEELFTLYDNISKSLCFYIFKYDTTWKVKKYIMINKFEDMTFM